MLPFFIKKKDNYQNELLLSHSVLSRTEHCQVKEVEAVSAFRCRDTQLIVVVFKCQTYPTGIGAQA